MIDWLINGWKDGRKEAYRHTTDSSACMLLLPPIFLVLCAWACEGGERGGGGTSMAFNKHNMSLLRQQPNNKTVHGTYCGIFEVLYVACRFGCV